MTISPTRSVALPLPTSPLPTSPHWPIALTYSYNYYSYEEFIAAGAGRVFDLLADMSSVARSGFILTDAEVMMRFNTATSPIMTVAPGRVEGWDELYVKRIYIINVNDVNVVLRVMA